MFSVQLWVGREGSDTFLLLDRIPFCGAHIPRNSLRKELYQKRAQTDMIPQTRRSPQRKIYIAALEVEEYY
jgi:hypothetical protein